MYPRPRARTAERQPKIPAYTELAGQITAIRAARGEPAAVVAGRREWSRFVRQIGVHAVLEFWPGGEVTMLKVPVIVRTGFDAPFVVETQGELEDLLLSR